MGQYYDSLTPDQKMLVEAAIERWKNDPTILMTEQRIEQAREQLSSPTGLRLIASDPAVIHHLPREHPLRDHCNSC